MKELRLKKELISIGNSKGIVIPSAWLAEIGWKEGDLFYIELDGRILKVCPTER